MESRRQTVKAGGRLSSARRDPRMVATSPSCAFDLRHQDEQMIRLMFVAAETASRFVRERRDMHAMQWLLAPQPLFDNRAAINACGEPEGFRRAIVLHGLGLDLHTTPESVATVPLAEFLAGHLSPHEFKLALCGRSEPRFDELSPTALYSCSISAEIGGLNVQIFCAMMARHPEEFRHMLRNRLGHHLEGEAIITLGFDWSEPIASALVSEATADMLSLIADEPTSPLAEGLDYQVEQRFAR